MVAIIIDVIWQVITSQCAKKDATPDFKFTFDIANGDELFVSSDFSNTTGWFVTLHGKSKVMMLYISYSVYT